MKFKIALAGNPNSGKTTLFNALTGLNQYVGNWPGVTVEKKEGKLKGHKDVTLVDLPGIYSLSPYTMEEVVARNFLVDDRPDAIIDIVDGTNIERNLYLTTQLMELGIPVVIAINMLDVLKKNGEKVNVEKLSKKLGCRVVEISALKGLGIQEAADVAVEIAQEKVSDVPKHLFNSEVEHTLAHIEEVTVHDLPEFQQRWYSIKLFERDEKVIEKLNLSQEIREHIEKDIENCEKIFDNDSESIITNERYTYISSFIHECVKKKSQGSLTRSAKIDKVLTNRFAALPIFAIIMFIVYYVSVTTIGTIFTDWANDGVFGDGWHLFTIGASAYEDASGEYTDSLNAIDAFAGVAYNEDGEVDAAKTLENIKNYKGTAQSTKYTVEDEDTLEESKIDVYYSTVPSNASEDADGTSYLDAVKYFQKNGNTFEAPDPASYGIWVPGLPVLIENGLNAIHCADWLQALILDGIVAGVGAVLGFVPQIFVLFIFLAFLEGCGYMARIAFILDRIFSKFGLSGKSFIPILIGSGCGVPGIMASRTIENDRDRRMTVMTTTFIPCSAKLPFIALIAGAIFGGAWWVAPSAYFLGIASILVTGIILKKTKMFTSEPTPFVMELPAYHMPTVSSILRSMWERGFSFIKKAGTIILLSTIVVWFATYFGFVNGQFQMLSDDQISNSILAFIGNCVSWIFIPLGWGDWQSAVASITGLVAKENIVGTLSILFQGGDASTIANIGNHFTSVTGFSFLAFNLLCAPCFASMGAIKREMNSAKWTFFAIGYQCGFAYIIAFLVTQFGSLIIGQPNIIGTIIAFIILALMIFMLVRPANKSQVKARTLLDA